VFAQSSLLYLHVCVLPEHSSSTGQSMFETLSNFMGALDPLWKTKMTSISTDGASAMTGRSAGLVSWLMAVAECKMYRVWFMAHQMNLSVKAAV
jgi:hypothetical protein